MLARYVLKLWNCTQFNKDKSNENTHLLQRRTIYFQNECEGFRTGKHFENTNYPNQSRCKVPPDWLRTTMAQIVPSLQLAKTWGTILTPYILHLTGRSRIFLHRAFFAWHYSLPPHQLSVFARLARWQLPILLTRKYCTKLLTNYNYNFNFTLSHFTSNVM